MYLNQTWILPQPLTSEKEIEDEKKSYGHEIRDFLGSVLKANLKDKGMYGPKNLTQNSLVYTYIYVHELEIKHLESNSPPIYLDLIFDIL